MKMFQDDYWLGLSVGYTGAGFVSWVMEPYTSSGSLIFVGVFCLVVYGIARKVMA